VIAWGSDTLREAWRSYAPNGVLPALALSPDGMRLYGVYPRGEDGCGSTNSDLTLVAWDAVSGQVTRELGLGEQVDVPAATCGRGGGVYLAVSEGGRELFIAWEAKLYGVDAATFKVTRERELPAPVDGLAQSVNGRELYLLPATAGDLTARYHGLWAVDVQEWESMRTVTEWDEAIVAPFMFAVPAAVSAR
jgi:hypothetical protein